jgi:hypothetical protein
MFGRDKIRKHAEISLANLETDVSQPPRSTMATSMSGGKSTVGKGKSNGFISNLLAAGGGNLSALMQRPQKAAQSGSKMTKKRS